MLLERIKLFVKVAKHENIAKTARDMHVSASSVSQRLKLLEKEFGSKLYRRNKDGIELTSAGWALLRTADQMLHQLDTLRQTLNPDWNKANQTLSVGGTYNPSAKYLPLAIAAFQKAHPEVKVEFLTSHRREVEKWIHSGTVEIAIVQNPSKSCIAELFTEHFTTDTLVVFAQAGDPLTKKQKITVQELANASLVVSDSWEATRTVLARMRSCGLNINVALRCDLPNAVKAAVRSKTGIGIVFSNLIEAEIQRREFKILTVSGFPRVYEKSYIVYDQTKPLSQPAAAFLALLQEMKPLQRSRSTIRNLTGANRA